MDKQHAVWQFALAHLQQNENVILLFVVASEGSSPGRIGFKMAVSADKQTGTVGGGALELQLIKQARHMLKTGSETPLLHTLTHDPEASQNRSGLICAGNQSVVLFPCGTDHVPVIAACLATIDAKRTRRLHVTPEGLSLDDETATQRASFQMESSKRWSYHELIGVVDTVYIIGSGHVGLALSRVLNLLDFHVVAVDDRPQAETFVNNHFVHEKIRCDYADLESQIPSGERNYAIIMTATHKTDEQALRQLIRKNLKYLGMLGSSKKRQTIYEHLQNEGILAAELEKVHSPIGIPITSKTADEIAISIAAELIREKNQPGIK